jgi:hypothetical protein
VILVRAVPSVDGGSRVVVGVDCEEDAVLSFAFGYAHRHHAGLAAVTCWKPDLLDPTSLLEETAVAERAAVTGLLEQRLRPWRQLFPDVPVLAMVPKRWPVEGLVSAALDQRLLVVGRRGQSSDQRAVARCGQPGGAAPLPVPGGDRAGGCHRTGGRPRRRGDCAPLLTRGGRAGRVPVSRRAARQHR